MMGICGMSEPIGSMVLVYMVTFTINISPMLAYIPYMDPMRNITCQNIYIYIRIYGKILLIYVGLQNMYEYVVCP